MMSIVTRAALKAPRVASSQVPVARMGGAVGGGETSLASTGRCPQGAGLVAGAAAEGGALRALLRPQLYPATHLGEQRIQI